MLVRPSGGGAVLTGPWMVSASVVLPLSHPWAQGRLPDSYRGLGQLHGEVLASLGVAAQALPEADVPAANARQGAVVGWACYGSLAPWELIDTAGRKLVGLAQRRQRAAGRHQLGGGCAVGGVQRQRVGTGLRLVVRQPQRGGILRRADPGPGARHARGLHRQPRR